MSTKSDEDDTKDDEGSLATVDIAELDGDDARLKPKRKLKEPKIWQNLSYRVSTGVGGGQIFIGVGSVICAVVGMARNTMRTTPLYPPYDNYSFNIAAGIWAGVIVITAGGLCIGAGIKKTTWLIVSTLVMSLFATMAGLAGIILASLGYVQEEDMSNSDEISKVMCMMLVVWGISELVISAFASTMCFITLCGKGGHTPDIYKNYRGIASAAYGSVMIVSGSVCVLCHMAGLMWEFWVGANPSIYLICSVQIWGSFYLVGGGALAIKAKSEPTTWFITSSMVMSLIAIIAAIAIVVVSTILIITDEDDGPEEAIAATVITFVVIGWIGSVGAASLGGVLCCLVSNKVEPKPHRQIEVMHKPNINQSDTVHGQLMYLDVHGLPAPAGVHGSAAHLQPMPGVTRGQMLHLRETNSEGQEPSSTSYIIQQPIILGYQHAIVQQTLIPLQQIDQDAMHSTPNAMSMNRGTLPLPHGKENTKGKQGSSRKGNRSNLPSPSTLPTLNPPAPPRGRNGPQVKMSSFNVSTVNENGLT